MASAFGNKTVCHNTPTYAKWKGGEQLTGISDCRVGGLPDKDSGKMFQPIPFAKGERYDVGMVYQQDSKPHFGVMGFNVLFVHRANATKEAKSPRTVDFQELWKEAQHNKHVKVMECKLCTFAMNSPSLEHVRGRLDSECEMLPFGAARSACMGIAKVAERCISDTVQTDHDLKTICAKACGSNLVQYVGVPEFLI